MISYSDYVCVLDLDWFELTLRLCNTAQFEEESKKVPLHIQYCMWVCACLLLCVLCTQLFSHLPDISLECSSNVLQIHTCVDSCIALRDLLVYLANDGDLQPEPRDYSNLARRNLAMVKHLMTLALHVQVYLDKHSSRVPPLPPVSHLLLFQRLLLFPLLLPSSLLLPLRQWILETC